MNKVRLTTNLLATALFIFAFASLAQAQSRTWVSGVGDDINPCSRTAPCKTFAGAIVKTAINGEINALDAGPYGTVNITKSITIDTHDQFASIQHTATNGVTVNFDGFIGTDVRKTVRLRNINFHGNDSGLNSIRIIGGAASANSEVAIEDCLLDGNQSALSPNARGISDLRTGGGKLFVGNTTIRNMNGTGIAVVPSSGATKIDVTLNDVRIFNCAFGVAVGSGTRVMANRVVISGCLNAGFFAEGPLGASELNIDNSVSSSNGTGVHQASGGTIRIGNSNIVFNAIAVTGTVLSYGNNRVAGGAGTLTAIGGDTHDKGQQ